MAKPGSLLDLLPRPRSPEFNALPKFIRDEIVLLRKGGRPVVSEDLRELFEHFAQSAKRLNDLAIEQRVLASTIKDVHKGQSEFGGKLLPLIEAIHKRLDEHQSQLSHHEKRLDAHDVQIGVHARKHVDHAEAITGIHLRVSAVEEQLITKRPKRRRKK